MRLALLATAFAFGCAPSVPRSSAAPAAGKPAQLAPESGAPTRDSKVRETTARPESPVRLEAAPMKPLSPAPFSIAEPRQGAFVPAAEASTRSVSVQGARGDLLIGLDEHPFRNVRTGSVRLGALLLEDEELSPGPHRLVVLQATEKGWVFAASSFSVGDESQLGTLPPVAPPSGVVLLDPHGTYNGTLAADEMTVVAWSLGSRAVLTVRLTGPKLALEKRANGDALRVIGLPSGDFRFDVFELEPAAGGRAVHAAGQWSTMSRVITVNRDAPVPSSAAAPPSTSAPPPFTGKGSGP